MADSMLRQLRVKLTLTFEVCGVDPHASSTYQGLNDIHDNSMTIVSVR
jgi:hypothetical protein